MISNPATAARAICTTSSPVFPADDLPEAGATPQDIAVAVGRVASCISEAFKRHGLARRNFAEVARLKWSTITAEQRAAQVSAATLPACGLERNLGEMER